MSEDPKLFDAGDYNLFRYCHNDPVDNVDPMGLADERREPWYNHEEQAKQLAKLQTLLNQKLLLGYGAISVGGLQYTLTQLQQSIFGMVNADRKGAGLVQTASDTWAGGKDQYYFKAHGLGKGWGSEDAAAIDAIDHNIKPHLYGTGDNREIAGGTFRNRNGSWGYSVVHSDKNNFYSSVPFGVPPGFAQHSIWHIHTGDPRTVVNGFSKADKSWGMKNYLGTPNGMIQVFEPSTWSIQVIRPGGY